MNGEIVTTQSFQEVDGLEENGSSEIPLLWEVILYLIFLITIN